MSTMFQSNTPDVAIIVLFGPTGSGKTTFANIASGSSMRVGNGLKACTQDVEQGNGFLVDGRPVVVIDCPGFDDTYLTETEILKRLGGFLAASYSSGYKITGLIYMHRITDTRVGGTSFRHMNMFRELCGTESLKNVIYVTNMWSDPPTKNELLREAELRDTDEFFATPISQGAQMARHWNTRESAHDVIRLVLARNPTVPKLSRELVDENKDLEDTSAGRKLGSDLERSLRALQEELQALRDEHAKAIKSNNENWKRQLENQKKEADEKYRNVSNELASLREGHSEDKQSWSSVIETMTSNYQTTLDTLMREQTKNRNTIDQQNARIEDMIKTHAQQMKQTQDAEADRLAKMAGAYETALAEGKKSACVIA